ncbi:16S rRNA (guanine(966)-N(2))-methyltransferase RsmD [Candidatus Epulonipiscioides saccharophilum]|nr:16S rRNA (guanine(966)-N(2))-methyltransferase RsmD [Epulopiscium sp. SCG-B10WGA-EpuloB]
MRIISGKFRGTKLFTPDGLNTRPTTDRIKETLFNIINFDLIDSNFLDLFSGSGQIGIEALSRGATKVTFVEKNKVAYEILEKNLSKIRLQNSTKTYKIDIHEALKLINQQKENFDIIFMDPPYHYPELKQIVDFLLTNDILSKGGKLIIENATNAPTIFFENKLNLIKERIYPTTRLSIFERI